MITRRSAVGRLLSAVGLLVIKPELESPVVKPELETPNALNLTQYRSAGAWHESGKGAILDSRPYMLETRYHKYAGLLRGELWFQIAAGASFRVTIRDRRGRVYVYEVILYSAGKFGTELPHLRVTEDWSVTVQKHTQVACVVDWSLILHDT